MGNASSNLDLLDLLNKEIYIKEGGSFDSYQFKRTCVLDSLLTAIYITYITHPNVKALLDSNELFREIMSLLQDEKYVEARMLCMRKLKHVKKDDTSKVIDFYGSVNAHLPLFDTLVCESIHNPKPLKDSHIYKERFSFWMALGDPADPTLILGHCSTPKSLLYVEDEKKRIFAMQFWLLGKEDHMTMFFHCYKNTGLLYDNDANKRPFQSIDPESLEDDDICLVGYVNINQERECKFGILETGEGTGAKSFDLGASRSINLDPGHSEEPMEVDNMLCTNPIPVAIPETGEGLGTKPFHQFEIVPIVSNQEHPVKDIEMASCGSSDSD